MPAAASSNSSEPARVSNVLDSDSVKTLLDQAVVDHFRELGWEPDHTMSNLRLGLSTVSVLVAGLSHLWPQPFPDNFLVLCVCFAAYVLCTLFIQFLIAFRNANATFVSKPRPGDKVALLVCAGLEPFSPDYRVKISVRNSPRHVEATHPITSWFSATGAFSKHLFNEHLDSVLLRLLDPKSE